MHGIDLTVGVQTGLAWYYLLVALLNVGAAFAWTYWNRGQKLLAFESYLVAASLGLFGLLGVLWIGKAPGPALYVIGAIANGVAILVVLPASVYQQVRAGTAWAVIAAGFQVLGLVYALKVPATVLEELGADRAAVLAVLHETAPEFKDLTADGLTGRLPMKIRAEHAEGADKLHDKLTAAGATASVRHGAPVMSLALRERINAATGAVTFFFGSAIAIAAFFYFRSARVVMGVRIPFGFTDPAVMWLLLNVVLLFFGFSMTDYDFRLIVAKPDNVPITIMLFTVGFFTWLFLRKAVINDQRLAQGLKPVEAEDSEVEKVLVWPDLVYTEFICMIVFTVILVLWSVLLKAPLEEWANLTKTPNPSKAPWYFLGLQEMLVYYDPWLAGVVFPSLILFGLMAIPFIDFNQQGNGYFTFVQRKFAILVFVFGFIVLWVMMVILGTFLRGPGWNFFGPYQYWDPHLVQPLNNVDLSDFFWIHWLGVGKPPQWYLREIPGFVAVLAYLAVLPPLLAKTAFRNFFVRLGIARYQVFILLVLTMAALPLKMLLRWSFNLKYIVHIDEFFFNI